MIILHGGVVADSVLASLKEEISRDKLTPGLGVILVGDDPASHTYVASKTKACKEIGIASFETRLPASVSESELKKVIEEYNRDSRINGILLQLPLPKGLNEDAMMGLIDPRKDVDGLHAWSVGKLLQGLPTFRSCTPAGVCEILNYYKIPAAGQHAVVVGRSNIVGKPMAAMLLELNATVTICHSKTRSLAEMTRQADILIAAIGRPKFITADMVKAGAVVIDVGINRMDGKIVGDVDFEPVKEKASAITPVPGGVGRMTIAMLMKNTVQAYKEGHHVG